MTDDLKRKVFSVTIDYHETTENIQGEYWRNQSGHFDRLGDKPAVTIYCPTTRNITQLRWHSGSFPNGPHRNGDRPARIVFNPKTNQSLQTDYMKAGNYHRDGDKPASISHRHDGTLEEHMYWQHGQLHRLPHLGPAVIRFDEAGEVVSTEFWQDGKQLKAQKQRNNLDI